MKESLDYVSKNLENLNSVDYIFNYKKKLARNFLYFFFIIFFYKPFSFFSFNVRPIIQLKLETNSLLITDNNCIDNFFNFYI